MARVASWTRKVRKVHLRLDNLKGGYSVSADLSLNILLSSENFFLFCELEDFITMIVMMFGVTLGRRR